jgi:hypothetical protein
MIPKIKFLIAPVKVTAENLVPFLKKETVFDWSKTFYKYYPEFKKEISKSKNNKEIEKTLLSFLEKSYQRDKKILEKKKEILKKDWSKINNKIMKALSEIMETNWNTKEFYCGISLGPFNFRWIDYNSFDVFYKDDIKEIENTCIHELSHFIYFKKWKEVFPKANSQEFNEPHLVWKLSEMVPQIILNDERIQRVFKDKFGSYDEFKDIKIKNKPLLSYLQEFYNNKKDFTDFLKKSWQFVKKYEKEINKIK